MTNLEKRTRELDIPACPYLPQGKVVMIYRLPSESVSAGGIIVPDEHKAPRPCGVLLAAGLQARDVMKSSLIEIGDVVWFGRFAGWEAEVKRDPRNTGKNILQLKVEDILGSVDALERVENYDLEQNDDGQHVYVKKTRKAA